MDSFSWTYGSRVLQSRGLRHSSRHVSHSKPRKRFDRSEKLRHAAHTRKSLMPLLCSYHQFSDSSSISSFIAHSYSRDTVISETSNVEATPSPNPGLVYESFGTRVFPDEYSWSPFEIAEAVNGEIVRWGPSGSISIDTRRLLPGQWFFAISGQNYDGHDFVNETLATEKGCVGVIGNRVCRGWANGFVKVNGDTDAALEKMAKFARNRFGGIVVGLTGSVGKTTTRTMITLALGSLGRIYQTSGNLNAVIGVALTLIGIPLDAKAAVVELGMSRMGEILREARICCPSVRVILNVGPCHLEYLHSLENVAKAKGEILEEVKAGDVCVLNGDDPLVMSIPVPSGVRKVLFGRGIGCDVRLVSAENINGGRAVRVVIESRIPASINRFKSAGKRTSEMVEFMIHGPGLHQAMNACAATAVAVALGVPLPQIAESLSRFRPPPMRSQILTTRSGIIIINDAYNASPPSMAAAIESLKNFDCAGKRVCVLGDMLELGASEAAAHELVLRLCCDDSIGIVVLVGERFMAAGRKLEVLERSGVVWSSDAESVLGRVGGLLGLGDVVLVKGSRGMEMGKVVSAISGIDRGSGV